MNITTPSRIAPDDYEPDTRTLRRLDLLLGNGKFRRRLVRRYRRRDAYSALVAAWLRGLDVRLEDPRADLQATYHGRWPSYEDALMAVFDAEDLIDQLPTFFPNDKAGVERMASAARSVVWGQLRRKYVFIGDGTHVHVFAQPKRADHLA